MAVPVQAPTTTPTAAPSAAPAFAPAAYGLVSPAAYAPRMSAANVANSLQQIAQSALQASQARQQQMMAFDQAQTAQAGPGHMALGYSGADIAHAGSAAYQSSGADATSLSNTLARNLIAGQQMENEAAAQHNQNAYQQQQNAIQQELVPEHAAQYAASADYMKQLGLLQQAKSGLTAKQGQLAASTAQKNTAQTGMINREKNMLPPLPTVGGLPKATSTM